MAKAEAKKTNEDVMAELEKKYGKGTIQNLDDSVDAPTHGVVSTGSFGLDLATGIGGLPYGRIVEIVGPESSGKTTIATHTMINAQKAGHAVLMADVEHTFDFKYASRLGLSRNKDKLKFFQPEYGEMTFDILKALISTGDYRVAVIDSIAANIPKEQHDGETGQSRMARLAALMSLETPKMVPILDNAGCLLICLNQYRSNIGGYGNPEKAAGGDSLKYYCSMRLDVRKTAEKDDHRNETRVTMIKNKCAPPFEKASFYIGWGTGIDRVQEILDKAVEYDIVKKGGSWITIEDQKVQGEPAALKILHDNPGLVERYEQEIKSKIYAA